jgi:hypothetical protein
VPPRSMSFCLYTAVLSAALESSNMIPLVKPFEVPSYQTLSVITSVPTHARQSLPHVSWMSLLIGV